MLKKLALWIPQLNNLHVERNIYAQTVQRLELEKNQLQSQIEKLIQSSYKVELNVLTEQVSTLSATIWGLYEKSTVISDVQLELNILFKQVNSLSEAILNIDEKTTANCGVNAELSALTKQVSSLYDAILGIEEKKSIQFIQNEEKSSGNPDGSFDLSDRGLFVVGHARSGTTILLDALNSSRDVYCLGEANLHKNVERTDFCSWFNTMHRSFNNPLMKSSYLPDFTEQSGWNVLKKMAESYLLIGEKVAFRQEELGYDYASFFNFSAKHFQSSSYICVIRHPRYVSASNIEMFESGRLDDITFDTVSISQLQCYYLILCLALTLKNVFVVAHERIEQKTFNFLGAALNINLDSAGSYYDYKKTVTTPDFAESIPEKSISKTVGYYDRFLSIFSPETLQPINSIYARNLIFDLYAELKSIDRLPSTGNFA